MAEYMLCIRAMIATHLSLQNVDRNKRLRFSVFTTITTSFSALWHAVMPALFNLYGTRYTALTAAQLFRRWRLPVGLNALIGGSTTLYFSCSTLFRALPVEKQAPRRTLIGKV